MSRQPEAEEGELFVTFGKLIAKGMISKTKYVIQYIGLFIFLFLICLIYIYIYSCRSC